MAMTLGSKDNTKYVSEDREKGFSDLGYLCTPPN